MTRLTRSSRLDNVAGMGGSSGLQMVCGFPPYGQEKRYGSELVGDEERGPYSFPISCAKSRIISRPQSRTGVLSIARVSWTRVDASRNATTRTYLRDGDRADAQETEHK